MSTSVGKLTADLIARTKKFEAGMNRGNKSIRRTGRVAKKTQAQVRALGASMRRMAGAAVALAGVAGFGMAIRSSIEFGSKQSDIALQLKVNTEAFQVYAGTIRDAGGTQNQLVKSLASMQQAIVQGSEGLTTFTRAFDRLGLNVDRIRALKTEKQFEEIARAVSNATDKQGAFTAVIEIFGKRNAPQLIEVMQRLARDGYGKLGDEIRKTYGIMDEETQRRLDIAADRIEQFKNRMTIRVGEIIAGEENFAALKQSLYRVASITAKAAAFMADRFLQYNGAAWRALADFVADRIGIAFTSAMESIKIKASSLMLELQARNPLTSPKEFKELLNRHDAMEAKILADRARRSEKELETLGSFFKKRVGEFKAVSLFQPMANDAAAYFDRLANEQRKLLENSRKLTANPKSRADFLSNLPSIANPQSASGLNGAIGLGGSISGGGSMGFDGFDKKVTSSMLRGALKKLESTAAGFRRSGMFDKSSELLGQRFGIRRQISATRTQERIDRIRSGETSFRASNLTNPRNMSGDPTERMAKLQERNVELLEIIKNEFVAA